MSGFNTGEDLPRSRSLIRQGMEQGTHLGAQLYVGREGRTIADFAVGESAAGVPLGSDILMLWMSSTKPITAVAIAQLWERNLLRPDDRVAGFIPEFGTQGKETITVRQLLTHTGGFRGADRLPDDLSWGEAVSRICQTPLESGWRPGEKAGYHTGSSWMILGEMVRRLDGRTLDRYVREEVFEPLEMRDSWIGMPPEDYRRYGDRIGVMHRTDCRPVKPHPLWNSEAGCALCRPGSNGRGPIRELGKFYEWLLQARRGAAGDSGILKPATVGTLTARHRIGMFDETFRHTIDWGLGFIVNSNRYGVETVPYGYGRHASEETFGHSGAQSSTGFADPAHRLVVCWVFNGMAGERAHQQRARELNTAIYEDLGLAGE